MSIATMLPMGELTNPGQMRLALVQVVNWGTFHGAHTMHVDRNGTLLTGNSGVGKSTLFDAMLRVFDARPRSNEAAAQRAGGAVEDKRTTFTYMRGKVGDKAVGEGSASAFQRPGATWSAVALTFDNAAGTRVTVSALFDVPKNGTESSVGRFYLIDNKPLDLPAIEDIAEKRFTKAALEAVFPDAQIFDVHKAFAERFRRLLGISSDQALPLLRVIQAGKGLGGSVNTFFRDQVLDAPATLSAADAVVEEFSNLMSIRQRLEDVRQQRDQLAPVPGLNKEYAQSLLDANRLRELAGEEFEAYKQQLAVTVHQKTLARFKELAQAKARELGAERTVRDGLAKELRELEADYNNQGGNAISAIEQSLENARVGLRLREQVEEAARTALSDAGLQLDWSAEGWEQAHEQAAARAAELKDDSQALQDLRFEAFDGHATKKREFAAAQQELLSLKTRKSLLPPSSIENRAAIAAATGVPEDRMPFGGELMDLAEGQEHWRPAAERALRNLATTLLVPGEHFAAVTRYLNDHKVRGAVRAVDVSKPLAGGALAVEDVRDGDLLTKLDILASGAVADAGEWIRERIALDFAYPCVEDPDELAKLDKGLSLGGVVKRNRHTVEKDDRFTGRQDYVLGFDNAAKLELVAAQVADLQQELAKAAELAQSREESHQGMSRQLDALRRIAEDHRPWEQVSAAVAAEELTRIEQRLKDALAAQADLEPLRTNIETARQKHQASTEAAAVLQSEYKALDRQLSAADSLLEAARARLAQAPPSDATVSALEPHFADFGDVSEMHELDNLANRVRTALLGELHTAETRGQATSERLTRIFEGFVREWGSAISADHGTSIGAAGEFEARYHAIVSDGLPAQESEFRQFFNQRTHESFSTLLHLLDEERRSITSRILPLNGILSEVNFHEGSFLELDIKQTLPATAKQFKDAIQNALKARHTRPVRGAAASGAETDDDAELTARYKTLETLVKRLGSATPEDRRWRAEVLDVRGHLFIQCKEHRKTGKRTDVYMHADTGSMSGGERQRFTAFIMAAALSYQLGIAEQGFTTYGTVMMDEAFVLASEEFAGAGIKALHEFGFQLLLAAPENVIDLSRHLGSVTEILRDKRTNRSGVLTAPVIRRRPDAEGEWRSEANPVDIVLR
ncbi:SbcC/MukB-like Walker B domain-containing protein [Pseudarthrobacter sp. H3Y2-7]|uniref:ATP-binding protein n=1 Tax=Pseudarthrobacter naphthalenicus TaxID=3031328 RepID=UPI0023AFE708|nr:SbcC/MukB-like Walker B domain-containing protein [Pseudarthrobacter sp. H3Y2-7]MDE8670443.1 SbcC/MukB-like Walker B domain-containing protein [Pseudarthrobacter sp. H3Y2-7]